jgi:Flp pilus assembly protein TadG
MKCGIARSLARFLSRCDATNLVEAAFVTPLLLLLTFSIVDFASMFYVYLALENGVSEATRYAMTGNQMQDPNNPANLLSREDSIKTAMRQATPTLTIDDGAFTFSHLPQGAAGWVAGTGNPGDIDKVTVNYTWSFMTPMISAFFQNGQIAITVESAMKDEPRFN